MKIATTVLLAIALLLAGASIGRAFDTDETVLNVQISSADHELQEGYFALGEQATVMVKPGSDLFRFLTRQRGNHVRIVLSRTINRELAKIER